MDWLAELFETNRIILLSVYGQVFFVMGLAIAFQSRQRSELPLARSLAWLAGFGIVHGLMNWGYLFVPIQAGFLPEAAVEALLLFQVAMKPIGFALLFQFGVELLISTRGADALPSIGGQPWLRLVPAISVALWLVGSVALSSTVAADFVPHPGPWLPSEAIVPIIGRVGSILAVGDVVARALIALPGSIVVAVGLRHTIAQLGPAAAGPVARAMRAAAITFAAYALLAGLIPMQAPFAPASILNDRVVIDVLGIPIEVFRSLNGLAMAIAVIASLELFERETDRALAEARRRELLMRERERIARDLHDGIIQSIYATGLHLERATANADPESRDRIRAIMADLNRIIADLRSTIFELGSDAIDTRDAEAIVLAVADELQANTLVQLDVVSEGLFRPRLRGDQAEHLRHLLTEALSNVLRHARATSVSVRMACTRRRLTLQITDDGIGHDPAAQRRRGRRREARGIANMHRRAELLDGTLQIEAAPGHGTSISLTMPVATTRRGP